MIAPNNSVYYKECCRVPIVDAKMLIHINGKAIKVNESYFIDGFERSLATMVTISERK